MPKQVGSPTAWTKQLFLEKVIKDPSGCWFLPTNKTRAHAIAWRLFEGEIQKSQTKGEETVAMCICHSCDNPQCCNPSHLFLGTFADNNSDRANKGRSYRPFGDLNVMKRDELKQKRRGEGNPMFGRNHSDEAKRRIGAAFIGELSPTKRPEVRAKLSASGKAVKDIICEHCGREMKPWSYARWHGDNCNERKN